MLMMDMPGEDRYIFFRESGLTNAIIVFMCPFSPLSLFLTRTFRSIVPEQKKGSKSVLKEEPNLLSVQRKLIDPIPEEKIVNNLH